MSNKTFRQKKNALIAGAGQAKHYALRITHYALRIELIAFPSLAGQSVIVNRAVLPTSDHCLSAPSQVKLSDINADSLPATVA